MKLRRILLTAALVGATVTTLWAARMLPLSSRFDLMTELGVTYEGSQFYTDGQEGVLHYFGVNGRNMVLHTYSTERKLRFHFDPGTAAFERSGLKDASFATQVNIYGINYYGPFVSMGEGTTAQMKTTIEFYQNGHTYYLEYPALAAKRLTADTWLVTSDPTVLGGDPGFTASPQADFGVFRRRNRASFGAVNMPIQMEVKVDPAGKAARGVTRWSASE
jgi:hypothetical protein